MKNIYDNNNIPPQDTNPTGTTEGTVPSPEQTPFQQPIYGQPVYYVPVGQIPYGQPGYPVQQIPLTQEQLNMIFQQYGVQPQYMPPQPQPFRPAQEAPQNDSGMRVLYQSEDFDRPLKADEDDAEEEDITSQAPVAAETKKAFPQKPVPVRPSPTDDIEIEEETIDLPHQSAPAARNSFTVEEMEMSTYELNSILLRQNRAGSAYQRPAPDRSRDVPLGFGGFEIEDMADEVVTDVSSDTEEKAEKKDKKKLSRFEIIRRTVLGIAIAAIIISSAMLINEYRLSSENNKLEEGISDLIITEPSAEATEKNEGSDKEPSKKKDKDKNKTTTEALTPEQQWAAIQKEYPNVIFPMGLQLKYAKLYATNQDFVGYLEADGINLSLPIVQAENDKKYLEKNFYGKSTKYGCPFVTHVNNIVELDMNTIIFGHHMNNGTVFGALDAYKTIDGFRAAPVITFNTLYKDYSWKVVAAFITNAYEEDDNGYLFRYYFASLSTQDRFAAYLNEMSQRSLYDTGVDVLPTDKLLTLSTCSHEFDDARFVVVARLVRPGESTDVDVTRATVNPSPRYPQAYYDKKKLDNPYVNASRWEVG
ncbi:MAG: class B sortase [Ruminococcaceae bacterium]|nr:class B sortase [Oscillospiraceae bacterium]